MTKMDPNVCFKGRMSRYLVTFKCKELIVFLLVWKYLGNLSNQLEFLELQLSPEDLGMWPQTPGSSHLFF